MDQPAIYRIRIKGHLNTSWADWFDGFALEHDPNGETTLTGPIVDQSALQGVLLNIGNLGLTLIAVNRVTLEEKE